MKLIKPLACYLTLFTLGNAAYAQAHSEWIFGVKKQLISKAQARKTIIYPLLLLKINVMLKGFIALKKKHIESVQLLSKNNMYNVFVGPLHSAEAVRQTGMQLGNQHPPQIASKQLKTTNDAAAEPMLTKKPSTISGNILTTSDKVLTLSLGSSWAGSQSVSEGLAPEIINTYAGNSDNKAFVVGEIFAGLERELSPSWRGQLGLALAGGGNANLTGDIWENGEPGFNNFTYSYSVNRVYVGLKAKLLKEIGTQNMQPYVNGSIGLGFNHAYAYSSTPKIFEESAVQPFGSHVTPTFAYSAGAGIQKALTTNWALGVGYEFSDWGRSSLGSVTGSSNSENIVLAHLYNNAVLVNLSYHR